MSVIITNEGITIPLYKASSKQWTTSFFYNKEQFTDFVQSCFKEPGEYGFNEDYLIVNEQARLWTKTRSYCIHPFKSKDFISYWDDQKLKCRQGIIIESTNGIQWYITRDYYMWLNFLPIFHKDKRKTLFPDLYDGQYHTALYELLGELNNKHAVVLKKRQYAMSYYHMAKLINQIWFEEGVTLKLLGYNDSYINQEGCWAFLNEYRDFLNKETAWYRPFDPDKTGSWQQRFKTTINRRDLYKGLKGRLMGITTQQSPTKGVGGAARYIIGEESGINPTLDKSYGYAKSALEAGMLIIGQFIAYGSVGDLKQCDPLKKFINRPTENGFYGVPTKFYDNKGGIKIAGLFIPEVWNMLPFSDKYGNSDVQGAIAALLEKRIQLKKDLDPNDYQLEISQHPITIEEAFDWREESPFPIALVNKQLLKIENNDYPCEFLDLYINDSGVVDAKISNKRPIDEFPIPKGLADKTGVLVVYERPSKKPEWGTYFASIDPVSQGMTRTSDSLASIFIYKNSISISKEKDDGSIEHYIEGDKIVAEWCGRHDDLNKTHELLEMIIEWYNAWTLVEANVGLFFTHMILKNKTKYLVPSNQMLFNKELLSKSDISHPYGWKNFGNVFTKHILPYGIEYLSEILSSEQLPNGDFVNIRYGIERIPSKMLLKEMKSYHPGLNVDRIISYASLIAFVKIQNASRRVIRRSESKPEDTKDLYKISRNSFRSVGRSLSSSNTRPNRQAFKNLK